MTMKSSVMLICPIRRWRIQRSILGSQASSTSLARLQRMSSSQSAIKKVLRMALGLTFRVPDWTIMVVPEPRTFWTARRARPASSQTWLFARLHNSLTCKCLLMSTSSQVNPKLGSKPEHRRINKSSQPPLPCPVTTSSHPIWSQHLAQHLRPTTSVQVVIVARSLPSRCQTCNRTVQHRVELQKLYLGAPQENWIKTVWFLQLVESHSKLLVLGQQPPDLLYYRPQIKLNQHSRMVEKSKRSHPRRKESQKRHASAKVDT